MSKKKLVVKSFVFLRILVRLKLVASPNSNLHIVVQNLKSDVTSWLVMSSRSVQMYPSLQHRVGFTCHKIWSQISCSVNSMTKLPLTNQRKCKTDLTTHSEVDELGDCNNCTKYYANIPGVRNTADSDKYINCTI